MTVPPEQASGDAVDHRADIYALAAVAYRSLTGRPPVTGRGAAKTEPAGRRAVDVERVLAIGLAKQRGDRFASALELAGAFSAAVAGALPKQLRDRPDELLDRWPWG